MGKGSSSPPPAPDYTGAANATAAGNLAAVQAQIAANRVDQYTPYGSQTYTKNGDTWTQNTTLTPEAQHALDSQLAMQSGRSDVANNMMGTVANQYKDQFNAPKLSSYTAGVSPVDQSSVGQAGQFSSKANQNLNFNSTAPALNTNYDKFTSSTQGLDTGVHGFDGANASQAIDQNAPQFDPKNADIYAQKAYEAQMALLKPGMDKEQQSLNNSLALQGLNPGTEANNNATSSYQMARAAQMNSLAASSYLSGANTAQGNYASQLAGFNAGNAAKNLAYGQSANTYGLNAQATQQANAARTQELQNQLQSYGANQSAQTASNAASAQQYAQQLQAYQAQNQASNTQYNQDAATYGANLQGLQTNAQLQAAHNAAQGQAYSQGVNNYGMDYQAALQARNQPLNEMNALISGQQVQNPNFNSYALQGNAGGADILGATQAQGQYAQGVYNQQQASAAQSNASLAGLAGTAAMAVAF